jgi:hypothetical protein
MFKKFTNPFYLGRLIYIKIGNIELNFERLRVMSSLNENTNQIYYFTTTVSEEHEQDDFIIEFFTNQPDDSSEDLPFKITKTFDELIDFLEQLDE